MYSEYKTAIHQILLRSKKGIASPDESLSSSDEPNAIGAKDHGEQNGQETTADKYKRLDSARSYREYKLMEEAVIEEARQPKGIVEDGNNIDLAATKIQAAYRGHKVRSEMNTHLNKENEENLENKLTSNDNNEADLAATAIQAAYRGHLVRSTNKIDSEPLEQENDENPPNYKDSEEANQAATKIQAAYKGHFVRSNNKIKQENMVQTNNESSSTHGLSEEADEAATKIQSAYKGYNVRSKNTSKKNQDYRNATTKEASGIVRNLEGENVISTSANKSSNNSGNTGQIIIYLVSNNVHIKFKF